MIIYQNQRITKSNIFKIYLFAIAFNPNLHLNISSGDEYQDDFEDNLSPVKQPTHLAKSHLSALPSTTSKALRSDAGKSTTSNAEKCIQKYSEKHPFKAMEKSILDARRTLDRLKGTEEKVLAMEDEEQKKLYVDNQNKKLRKELKRMNDNLNKLIDYIKDLHLKKKDEKQRPISGILRARHEEVKNSDKQIMNLMTEHQRLTKRLSEISDPSYMINLRNGIKEAEDKIKQLKREKKDLEVEQFRKERKMDKIITYNEPENMRGINDAQKELEVVSTKLNKLHQKREKLQEFKATQDEQMAALKNRLEKVMKKAEEYGINEDIKQEEIKMKEEKKMAEKENLLRKKKIILQAFDSQKKKVDLEIMKEKKDYKELCSKKKKLNMQLDEKINVLKDKTEKMSELIEKAKKYSDPNTQELLSKWEMSNQKMKDMYELEAANREEMKDKSNDPTPKDIDKLIKKMQKEKPPSKKKLPEVKSHKKSINEFDSDADSKTNKSITSSKKPPNSERSSILGSMAKPPLNIESKREMSDNESDIKDEKIEDRIKEQSDTQSQKEEVRSNISKPSFSSKPFGKPKFATKPAFGARAESNESRGKNTYKPDFESVGNASDKAEERPQPSVFQKEPVSFSEKYGLAGQSSKQDRSLFPKPNPIEENKNQRIRNIPSENYVPSGMEQQSQPRSRR
jgi:myosin heavy subunit